MINQYLEGDWHYNSAEKTLKHTMATDKELGEAGLIDEEGYLLPSFKEDVLVNLKENLEDDLQGPFGDHDIFCGDIYDNETIYCIELHHVSQSTLDALAQRPNFNIIKTDTHEL